MADGGASRSCPREPFVHYPATSPQCPAGGPMELNNNKTELHRAPRSRVDRRVARVSGVRVESLGGSCASPGAQALKR
jgi:hypothetical protein